MKHSVTGASVTTSKPRTCAPPPTRTKNKGWTKQAARRHRRFLWTVVPTKLSGICHACTFTLGDNTDTPQQFAALLNTYLVMARRKYDITRYHWVIEWQERGVPHLHMTFWSGGSASGSPATAVPTADDHALKEYWNKIPHPLALRQLWCRISRNYNTQMVGQMVKEVDFREVHHWIGYLAKHAARGVSNYQRHWSNIPAKWQGNTGRVWGKGGDWPIVADVVSHGLSSAEEYQVRRLFCRYMASNPASMRVPEKAKKSTSRYWKNFLKCTDVKTSRFRAPAAFIDIERQLELVKCVQPDAYFVWMETGEIFENPADCPIDRVPDWKRPAYPHVEVDMSDIMGAVA